MWPQRQPQLRAFEDALRYHSLHVRAMPGIDREDAVTTLAMQFVASSRREDYYALLQQKTIAAPRANPASPSFQPERAVAHHLQNGNVDEAAWLIFLMTHFAKPIDTEWVRLQDIYGMLGCGIWDWATVAQHPEALEAWLDAHWHNVRGRFGNHRKYESLRPDASRSMSRVVRSYCNWIGPNGHQDFFSAVVQRVGNNPTVIYDSLYHDMRVVSFGRLAKFDYLTMLGRYDIAPIEPGSAYLTGATGPLKGARLLFDGDPDTDTSPAQLQRHLDALDVNVAAGMSVIEDALCNWQKSPYRFHHFRG